MQLSFTADGRLQHICSKVSREARVVVQLAYQCSHWQHTYRLVQQSATEMYVYSAISC